MQWLWQLLLVERGNCGQGFGRGGVVRHELLPDDDRRRPKALHPPLGNAGLRGNVSAVTSK